jgi:hypothetical protein
VFQSCQTEFELADTVSFDNSTVNKNEKTKERAIATRMEAENESRAKARVAMENLVTRLNTWKEMHDSGVRWQERVRAFVSCEHAVEPLIARLGEAKDEASRRECCAAFKTTLQDSLARTFALAGRTMAPDCVKDTNWSAEEASRDANQVFQFLNEQIFREALHGSTTEPARLVDATDPTLALRRVMYHMEVVLQGCELIKLWSGAMTGPETASKESTSAKQEGGDKKKGAKNTAEEEWKAFVVRRRARFDRLTAEFDSQPTAASIVLWPRRTQWEWHLRSVIYETDMALQLLTANLPTQANLMRLEEATCFPQPNSSPSSLAMKIGLMVACNSLRFRYLQSHPFDQVEHEHDADHEERQRQARFDKQTAAEELFLFGSLPPFLLVSRPWFLFSLRLQGAMVDALLNLEKYWKLRSDFIDRFQDLHPEEEEEEDLGDLGVHTNWRS